MPNDSHKTTIDRVRDGAITMTVGEPADGRIVDMISVSDLDMYTVHENAIYRVMLADAIDPERTNVGLSNSNQRIASSGTNSEIVSRSFLTAHKLFNSLHFAKEFDRKFIIYLSIKIMKEMLAAEKIKSSIKTAEKIAKENLNRPKDRTFAIPSINDLEPHVKGYIQKIEHTSQALFKLTQIFYAHKKAMFTGFTKEIESTYGSQDEFTIFSQSMEQFMVFIRNARHCVEHPKLGQHLIVRDFSLSADGKLSEPTVEVIHNETPHSEMSVSMFMDQVLQELLSYAEHLMAYLAAKHIMPDNPFHVCISLTSSEQRREGDNVRFGYFTQLGGEWLPLR